MFVSLEGFVGKDCWSHTPCPSRIPLSNCWTISRLSMKAGPRPRILSWGVTVFPPAQALGRRFFAATSGVGGGAGNRMETCRHVQLRSSPIPHLSGDSSHVRAVLEHPRAHPVPVRCRLGVESSSRNGKQCRSREQQASRQPSSLLFLRFIVGTQSPGAVRREHHDRWRVSEQEVCHFMSDVAGTSPRRISGIADH